MLDSYIDDTAEKEETLEDFVKRVSPSTKLYIYNSSAGTFLSQKSLDELYGDMYFVQSKIRGEEDNSFNLLLKEKVDDGWIGWHGTDVAANYLRILKWQIQNLANLHAPAIRIGLVKCLMAEPFFPFQETMNRVLVIDSVKQALKKKGSALITFINGQLIHAM